MMILQATPVRTPLPFFTHSGRQHKLQVLRKKQHQKYTRQNAVPNLSTFGSVQQMNLSSIQTKLQSVIGDLPPEVLLAGAAAIALLLILIAVGASQQGEKEQVKEQPDTVENQKKKGQIARENCVLVFGSTGGTGKAVIEKLVATGRQVVATARTEERAKEVLGNIPVGKPSESGGILFLETGVDIASPGTISQSLFEGVYQTVISVGGSADGQQTPEIIDYQGVSNIVKAAKQYIKSPSKDSITLDVINTDKWETIDDTIMGGESASKFESIPDSDNFKFSGNVIVKGGGFCGFRVRGLEAVDVSAYDGVCVRVKGDGSTFKMNIKTDTQEDVRSDVYQATFDTIKDAWVEVKLPWWQFQFISLDGRYRQAAYEKPAFNPKETGEKITGLSILYSRFNYSRLPNPNFHAGEFELDIEKEFKLFKNEVPQIVMVSSAGVERNALIGNDQELRQQQIRIVQMNPNNILHWKYAGENEVRSSGLTYTIVRPTGLKDDEEEFKQDALLDFQQGDYISGLVGRGQVAQVIAKALEGPETLGKTFEVTKNQAAYAKSRTMDMGDYRRLFLGLCNDWERTRHGLKPLPVAVLPGQATPAQEEGFRSELQKAQKWVEDWKARKAGAKDNGVSAMQEPSDLSQTVQISTNGYNASLQEATRWVEAWKQSKVEA
eukprot:TRINITY_DN49_c1_g1_i1.p1 TRINITY_DN49_c1_g1~~TRINITY_DN49_c1_g1_i1.p1  ORF type:complete len:665 (-),score=77.66 TRINITY_DN49_c1_g1_i1:291-2285(-)